MATIDPFQTGYAKYAVFHSGRAVFQAFSLLLLVGCTTTHLQPEVDRERLLDGVEVFGAAGAQLEVPDVGILAVTDEMRRYLSAVTGDTSNRVHAVDQLVKSLFDPAGHQMEYDQSKTLTASEAFAARRGNCLSYSNLLIAFARQLGLEAEFREVEIPPSWDEASEDIYLYDLHVNVSIGRGKVRRVFDVNAPGGMSAMMKLPSWSISDERAFAQYYSNIGVSHLLEGDLVRAFGHFRKALRTDPGFLPVWVNLGILYRRAGKPDFAEAAYYQVLRETPHDYPALSNLAHLYQSTGDLAGAARVGKQVERERRRNPYYRYRLAMDAFEAGDYDRARIHLLAAIRQLRDEPRLHLFLGAVNLQLEHPGRAAANFKNAGKLAGSEEERERVGNKAKLLKSIAERGYQSD